MGVRVLLHSPAGVQRLPVGDYLLGRGTDCDIVIPSGRASRRHARISVTEDGALLEDLSSSNGTHVNGVQISGRHRLEHDDFIVIGETGLEIAYEDAGEGTEAPDWVSNARPGVAPDTDATLSTHDRQRTDKWIQTWGERVLAQARAGQLTDEHSEKSAIRFGVELARQWRTTHWVDFVLELGGLGVRLPLERAKTLDQVIDEVGVAKQPFEAFAERVRNQSLSDDQRGIMELIDKWRTKIRPGP